MSRYSGIFEQRRLVLAGIGVASALVSAGLQRIFDGYLPLFGRWDVLACGLLAALPLAVSLSTWAHRWTAMARFAVIVVCVLLSLAMGTCASYLTSYGHPDRFLVNTIRAAIALSALLALLVSVSRLSSFQRNQPRERRVVVLAVMSFSAFLIPPAYADAIADRLNQELNASLESRRFESARRFAYQLREIQPSTSINDRPIQAVARELDEIVVSLTDAIGQPLPREASFAEQGQRVTLLMCLDRNQEALSLLQAMASGSEPSPVVLDYEGLCHQRLGQFDESEAAYRRAVSYWEDQPSSDRRRACLASAWKGIGFAARRLNRRSDEEYAYRKLVEVMPTAESNLLLAQCYHEHQKTTLASQHAAIAMELDPHLRDQSESILSSMAMEHFGCLQVPRR